MYTYTVRTATSIADNLRLPAGEEIDIYIHLYIYIRR